MWNVFKNINFFSTNKLNVSDLTSLTGLRSQVHGNLTENGLQDCKERRKENEKQMNATMTWGDLVSSSRRKVWNLKHFRSAHLEEQIGDHRKQPLPLGRRKQREDLIPQESRCLKAVIGKQEQFDWRLCPDVAGRHVSWALQELESRATEATDSSDHLEQEGSPPAFCSYHLAHLATHHRHSHGEAAYLRVFRQWFLGKVQVFINFHSLKLYRTEAGKPVLTSKLWPSLPYV